MGLLKGHLLSVRQLVWLSLSRLSPRLTYFPAFGLQQAHGSMGACATALRFLGRGKAQVFLLAALATTDVTGDRPRLLAVFH